MTIGDSGFNFKRPKGRTMKIRDYWRIDKDIDEDREVNALDAFIHTTEPAGARDEKSFREGLQDAVDFIVAETLKEK